MLFFSIKLGFSASLSRIECASWSLEKCAFRLKKSALEERLIENPSERII